MSEIKLLPCPFCGGEAKTYFLNGLWIAECNSNKCIGAKISCGYRKEEDATKAWNTRKPIDDMVEQLEHRRLEYEVAEENASNDTKKIYYSGIKRGYEYSKDIVRGGRE